jgi:ribosomal protein S27E
MTDDELLTLARQVSTLTDEAKQILAAEILTRRLKFPAEEPAVTPEPEICPDSPYAEDRKLIEICKVWSLRDALQLQWLLDRAGIPFYMGPEKATGVEVTSNFADGVSVQIMQVGLPWAMEAMQSYIPADEPLNQKEEHGRAIEVRCPRCDCADVIFKRLTPRLQTMTCESAPRYEWTCHACKYEWEDDGVVAQK